MTDLDEDMRKRAEITGEVSRLPDPAKLGGLYLHPFHGRIRKDEDLDDWGFHGPHLGPLAYVHITYASDVKFAFETEEDASKFGLDGQDCMVDFEDGLFPYKGGYYGDLSVYVYKG